MSADIEIDDLTAELLAADVAAQLAKIANAQHRISCALASSQRQKVLANLRHFGITEAAAQAYVSEPLNFMQVETIIKLGTELMARMATLKNKVRAIAVAEKQ